MSKTRDLNYYKKTSKSVLRDCMFTCGAFLIHIELYYLSCDLNLNQFKEFNGLMALCLGIFALFCGCTGLVYYAIYDVKKKKENKLNEKK